MRNLAGAFVFSVLGVGAALAQTPHHCAEDALAKGRLLVKFHFNEGDMNARIENTGVDGEVAVLPPIKAPVGQGKFDVLEVIGYVYKAEYRMHFIYAQIPDSCVLMGQEILEMSNPY